MGSEGKAFEVGQWVRVNPHQAEYADLINDLVFLEKADWRGVIGHIVEWTSSPNSYRVDFMGGRLWFKPEELEVTADPRDAELAHLRAERDALLAALRPFADFWNVWRELAVTGETDDSFDIWLAWTRQQQMVAAHQTAAQAVARAEAGELGRKGG